MKRWKPWLFLGFALLLACRVHASGGLSLNGGSITVSGPASLDTTDDIDLSTGTLQSIGAAQFHVGGNWSQSGGNFAADHSTVFLTSNTSLSGTNHFYNLTGLTPGQTLTLESGITQTVAGTFTLAGSSGHLSKIQSSSSGILAGLINLTSNTVNDVDVRDIDAFGGVVISAGSSSVLIHTFNWSYGGSLLTPQPVTQAEGHIVHSGGAAPLNYSWSPVTTYADGTLVPPGIGTTYEITRYTDLGDTSNGTLVTDGLLANSFGPVATPNGAPEYFGIRAVINGVKSDPVYVDNNPPPNYAFASSNGAGYAIVPPTLQGPFTGITLPYVSLTLTTEAAPTEQGVLASGSLQIQTRGPGLALADYHFSPPGATLVLELTGPQPAAQTTFPVQINAGGTWKTVGTTTYSPFTNAFSFTVYQTGLYRVGANPLGSMSSVLQSVHPRIFSPNGDGYNDIVHFDLTNPGQEPAKGEIFDLRSAKVADLQPSPLGLQWDGRGPGGRVVPGGVYIYQIRVGHQRVNGTVVVVK